MKRGFPRPMAYISKTTRSPYKGKSSYGKKWDNRRYPWPYSASDHTISNISTGRMRECIKFKRCAVCGDPVEEEFVGLIIYNTRSPKVRSKKWLHVESGPYHLKCLNIAFTTCPHLADTKQFLPACGNWSDVRPSLMYLAERL